MFPLRDHNPSGRTPYVVYALIIANAAVFLGYWLNLSTERELNLFFLHWGLVPDAVIHGFQVHTVLTSMFLHGGWMHIIGNMLFLWIFGDNLEDLMGPVRFLIFYLLSGVAAAALQIGADPYSQIPMIGASGAVAGVMGGYLLLFPRARVDVLIFIVIFVRIFPVPAWLMLGFWLGLQLFSGTFAPTEGGGVAYWAHVGGFVAGLVMVVPMWLARGGPAFWNRTHGVPEHPGTRYEVSRSRIPTVKRLR